MRKVVPTPNVSARPLSDWGPVSVELLGTQTRFVRGPRWTHRIIEYGSGPILVLLHGVGGQAEVWARNVRSLGQHFHVVAADALFHGYSAKPAWDPANPAERNDMQVDAVVDLLDGLGVDRAHIEGESMGGQIACEFGLRYPERALKIVLNTGAGRVRYRKTDFVVPEADYAALGRLSAEAILRPTLDSIRERLAWLVHDRTRMTEEMAQIRLRLYQDPEVNDAMRRYNSVGLGKEDPWDLAPIWDEDALKGFEPEALVFWTDHNPGEGPDLGEYVADLIPGCRYYLMEDAGHWPQWEKPEEHDRVVLDFLLGEAGSAGSAER